MNELESMILGIYVHGYIDCSGVNRLPFISRVKLINKIQNYFKRLSNEIDDVSYLTRDDIRNELDNLGLKSILI